MRITVGTAIRCAVRQDAGAPRRCRTSPNVVPGGSVVVVYGGGLAQWAELVVAIVQALDSGNVDAIDGALDALFKARVKAPRCVPNIALMRRAAPGVRGGAGTA